MNFGIIIIIIIIRLFREGDLMMDNIVNKLTPEYLKDVLVRLAHHSSALEGNTITLPETATIILEQTLPSNSKITRREYFEVLNHEQAFEYVIENIQDKEALSIPVIKDIHEKLTDRLQYDKGQFKTSTNYIKGAEFPTTPPEQVSLLMEQLVGNLNFKIDHAVVDKEVIKAVLEAHITFEKIHPFSDGNGRTGRMMMNYSLIENGLPPLIIKKEDRGLYSNILHEAQVKEFPSDRDVEAFYKFAIPIMKEEEKRIDSFYNQEKNQILDSNGFEKKSKDKNNEFER